MSQSTRTIEIDLLVKRCFEISTSITSEPPRAIFHIPDLHAKFGHCFSNVALKVDSAGGGAIFGWTFHHRFVQDIPGPGYLFLTHHAVWINAERFLVDVTPYPEMKHKPLAPGGHILFLPDATAVPFIGNGIIAPQPLKYFCIEDDVRIAAHIARLNLDEQKKCAAIYSGVPQ